MVLTFHSFHRFISVVGNIVLHVLHALRVCVCVCLSAGFCKNYTMDFKKNWQKDGRRRTHSVLVPDKGVSPRGFCISVVCKLPSCVAMNLNKGSTVATSLVLQRQDVVSFLSHPMWCRIIKQPRLRTLCPSTKEPTVGSTRGPLIEELLSRKKTGCGGSRLWCWSHLGVIMTLFTQRPSGQLSSCGLCCHNFSRKKMKLWDVFHDDWGHYGIDWSMK